MNVRKSICVENRTLETIRNFSSFVGVKMKAVDHTAHLEITGTCCIMRSVFSDLSSRSDQSHNTMPFLG